jgi:hypothetical protein
LADFVEYCLVNDCQPEEKKTLSAKKKGGSTGRSAAQKQYYRKFKRLKKVIKDLIFVSTYILC